MIADLRERIDDLLVDVPSYVRADAARALREGARRRVRRRLVAGGAVVGVLALVGAAGLVAHRVTDPSPADGGGSTTSSFPIRVERPLLRTGTLPDDAGSVAGVIERPDGWYAVGQHGQVWRLPGRTDTDYPPSISPDGRWLTYLDARLPSLVTVNLATGESTDDDIGPRIPPNLAILSPHTQTFWSPDSSRLLVPVTPGAGQGEPIARVVGKHSVSKAIPPFASGRVLPAGWYDEDTLVWVKWTLESQGRSTVGSATVLLTDLRGHVKSTIPLRLHQSWIDPLTSTSVSVSPDGHLLALGTDQGEEGISAFTFRLDGSRPGRLQAAQPQQNAGHGSGCPASWNDQAIMLPGNGPPDTILRGVDGTTTIYADPRLDVSCSVWASDALGGTAYRSFTTRIWDDSGTLRNDPTAWLSWHWREMLVVGTAGLVALCAVLVWRRRRRESA